ncbi:hypothetical protein BDV25DRAFT_135326 [Aspergillus avenaceus]|uniref:BTB domain-containing protein n=1 Tax=Aspergillus avenaceus TaxID=36643 RepID=A0A5N6UA19_ASPAV|nr:hypothetical protein BDV25DRAFT_135326 [Aspergillus avenaceus]
MTSLSPGCNLPVDHLPFLAIAMRARRTRTTMQKMTEQALPCRQTNKMDYLKLCLSQVVTVRVGENLERVNVHASILTENSDILRRYLESSRWNYSLVLQDVGLDMFIMFCEYGYTGVYQTPNLSTSAGKKPDIRSGTEAQLESDSDTAPVLTPDIDEDEGSGLPGDPLQRGHRGMPAIHWTEPRKNGSLKMKTPSVRSRPSPLELPSASELHSTQNFETNSALYNELENLTTISAPDFPVAAMESPPYPQLWNTFRELEFPGIQASGSEDPDILSHARLYHFAKAYQVKPLLQQCLKFLHRDLCRFRINAAGISRILELLEFTYSHTHRVEDGRKSPLRGLVIHYVACQAPNLAVDGKFSLLLDSCAEMGSDLAMTLVGNKAYWAFGGSDWRW